MKTIVEFFGRQRRSFSQDVVDDGEDGGGITEKDKDDEKEDNACDGLVPSLRRVVLP